MYAYRIVVKSYLLGSRRFFIFLYKRTGWGVHDYGMVGGDYFFLHIKTMILTEVRMGIFFVYIGHFGRFFMYGGGWGFGKSMEPARRWNIWVHGGQVCGIIYNVSDKEIN